MKDLNSISNSRAAANRLSSKLTDLENEYRELSNLIENLKDYKVGEIRFCGSSNNTAALAFNPTGKTKDSFQCFSEAVTQAASERREAIYSEYLKVLEMGLDVEITN